VFYIGWMGYVCCYLVFNSCSVLLRVTDVPQHMRRIDEIMPQICNLLTRSMTAYRSLNNFKAPEDGRIGPKHLVRWMCEISLKY
jgi:hypothetical protein